MNLHPMTHTTLLSLFSFLLRNSITRTTRNFMVTSMISENMKSFVPNNKDAKKIPVTKRRSNTKRKSSTFAPPDSASASRGSSTSVTKEANIENRDDKEEDVIERTESFQPVSYQTFHPNSKLKIHTLLLGTHPSIKSLARSQYYGHPMKYSMSFERF